MLTPARKQRSLSLAAARSKLRAVQYCLDNAGIDCPRARDRDRNPGVVSRTEAALTKALEIASELLQGRAAVCSDPSGGARGQRGESIVVDWAGQGAGVAQMMKEKRLQ